MNKNAEAEDPFSRKTMTVVTADTLQEVIEGYRRRKASKHEDRVPYIAATVMPESWKDGSDFIPGDLRDKTSGGLSQFISRSDEFNRPILGLYSIEGSRFFGIPNPLYAHQPLSTTSRMEFERVFSASLLSSTSGGASGAASAAVVKAAI